MDKFYVNIQIFLHHKTFGTQVAGKVPGGGVSGRVFGQGGQSREGLATDTALVSSLPSVVVHVFHQVELVNKSLPTYSTHMRPLKSVLLHFVSVEVPETLSLAKLVNTPPLPTCSG